MGSCDCGRRTNIKACGYWVCQRCRELERERKRLEKDVAGNLVAHHPTPSPYAETPGWGRVNTWQ